MAEQAITQQCPFSETLYLFQADPELLTNEERVALESHLDQKPPCPLCAEEMIRNRTLLEAEEQVRGQRGARRESDA